MTLLSRKVDYALLILSYLHQNSGGGSAREIAGRFNLSRAFVANILKVLCNKGFVASHRGVKGGYALQTDKVAEAHLTDLMESLDEPLHLTECTKIHGREPCSVEAICPLKAAVNEVQQRMWTMLRQIKLTELFPVRSTAMPIGLKMLPLGSGEPQLIAQ